MSMPRQKQKEMYGRELDVQNETEVTNSKKMLMKSSNDKGKYLIQGNVSKSARNDQILNKNESETKFDNDFNQGQSKIGLNNVNKQIISDRNKRFRDNVLAKGIMGKFGSLIKKNDDKNTLDEPQILLTKKADYNPNKNPLSNIYEKQKIDKNKSILTTQLTNDYRNFSNSVQSNTIDKSISKPKAIEIIKKSVDRWKGNNIDNNLIDNIIEQSKLNGEINSKKFQESIAKESNRKTFTKINCQNLRSEQAEADSIFERKRCEKAVNSNFIKRNGESYDILKKGQYAAQKSLLKLFSNKTDFIRHIKNKANVDGNSLITKKDIFDLFSFNTSKLSYNVKPNDVSILCENQPFRPDNTTNVYDFADLIFGDIENNKLQSNHDQRPRAVRPPKNLLDQELDNIVGLSNKLCETFDSEIVKTIPDSHSSQLSKTPQKVIKPYNTINNDSVDNYLATNTNLLHKKTRFHKSGYTEKGLPKKFRLHQRNQSTDDKLYHTELNNTLNPNPSKNQSFINHLEDTLKIQTLVEDLNKNSSNCNFNANSSLKKNKEIFSLNREKNHKSDLQNKKRANTQKMNFLTNEFYIKALTKSKNQKNIFSRLDKDKDGYIDTKEFIDVVVNDMNLCNKTEAKQLFKSFDKDNKHSVDFNEFLSNFNYAQGECIFGKPVIPVVTRVDRSNEYLKSLPRNNPSQMKNIYANKSHSSTENIIKGITNSPSYISEKDRFCLKHNSKEDPQKSEQQMSINKKVNRINYISQVRQQQELNIQVKDMNIIENQNRILQSRNQKTELYNRRIKANEIHSNN